MIIRNFIAGLVVLLAIALQGAERKTVAVMNFRGYGDKSIRFLDNALPEAISSSLSEIKEIRIAERSQLGKILNEIALEQTGAIDTGGVTRAGKLAKADILILGSISGGQDSVIVTFKAVDVQTGTVLDSKTVKAPVSKIFEVTDKAARGMGALISGRGAGRVSVFSSPNGAEVYIDGINTGTTPLVGYSLTAGEHNIKLFMDGYVEHEEALSVKAGEEESISAVLAKSAIRDRTEIGFGVHYLVPTCPDISPAPLYALFLGHTFEYILASVEFGVSFPEHDSKIASPIGGAFTQERWYDLYFAHVSASYVPFPRWSYFMPYFGLSAGIIYAMDYRENKGEEDDKELLTKKTHFSTGVKAGVNILPYSSFSLFFEARYYYQPQSMTRSEYTSNGIAGDMTKHDRDIDFHFLSIGGGVKIFF